MGWNKGTDQKVENYSCQLSAGVGVHSFKLLPCDPGVIEVGGGKTCWQEAFTVFSLHEQVCHNFHMLLIKRFSIEILIMLLYVLNDTFGNGPNDMCE